MSDLRDGTTPVRGGELQAYARWAGFMYVFSMVVYMAQDFITAGFLVPGDYAATAQNVREGELLYRFGLALRVLGGLTLIGLGWTFYGLLRSVAPTVALVMLLIRGVQAALDFVGSVLGHAALHNYLAVTAMDEGQALARRVLYRADGDAFQIQFVYLGVVSLLLFWMLLKSRFIPRPLALFSLVASAALIGQGFAHLLFPEQVRALGLGMFEYIPMFIAEIGTGLWLLVRGADTRRLERAAPAG